MRRVNRSTQPVDRERGANLVEMALILPLLLLLLAAIADFGRAFNSYIVINNAAREGARYAGRVYHTDEIDLYIREAVIREAANSNVDLTDPNMAAIRIDPEDWQAREAKMPITITVEYTLTAIFTGIIGLDRIQMRSQSVMVNYTGVQPISGP
jgi:Flp pilus assembly protein TadG